MSAGIGALIAHAAFWVLLAYGWWMDELGARGIALSVGAWVAGYFGVTMIPQGADMFFSYVALLDVVLVFVIFKGDVRLT
jgi:hypothetical protein